MSAAQHVFARPEAPALSEYEMTWHAQCRARERAIKPQEMAQALSGRRTLIGGRVYHYDNGSRVVVITTPQGHIITAYRVKKSWVKRRLSK